MAGSGKVVGVEEVVVDTLLLQNNPGTLRMEDAVVVYLVVGIPNTQVAAAPMGIPVAVALDYIRFRTLIYIYI